MLQKTDSVMMPYLYLNLVQLYSDMGQLDSADFYGQKLLDMLSRTDCSDETKASIFITFLNYTKSRASIQRLFPI